MLRKSLVAVAMAGMCSVGMPAVAADLLQVYREAVEQDAQFAAARHARTAGEEKRVQGRSLLLPSVSLSGNTSWNQTEYQRPTVQRVPDYNTYSYSLQLTQPLFRWQNWTSYQQGELQSALAEVQFADARQNLILRVAQAYFDVLAAQEALAAVQTLRQASAEQLDLARKSFEVGTVTITDVHEAQSRFDLASAQEIQARNTLDVSQHALRVLIGRDPDSLQPLRQGVGLQRPQPEDMASWVARAEEQNPGVQQAELGFQLASREVDKSRAGHLPSLDLVAARSTMKNVIPLSGQAYEADTTSIGLQLSVPLFQGGSMLSRDRETVANREKSRAELENGRRQAALGARQAYLGVVNGLAQIRALEAAQVSSSSALDANKLGYEVGVRINIDVLNAQSQLADTRQKLARARFDTLMAQLRLKAAAGQLTEDDLAAVNALLGALMRRVLTLMLLACSLSAHAVLPMPVRQALQQAGIPETAVAVWVAPLPAQASPLTSEPQAGAPRRPVTSPTSPVRLAHQAAQPFNPASVMKLVTTAAALEQLGPDYRWRTRLRVEPDALAAMQDGVLVGDLFLEGSGDPRLDFPAIQRVLRQLRQRGIRDWQGDLVIDRRRFAPIADGTLDGQEHRAYNVPPDAALLHFHALELLLQPGDGPVSMTVEPPLAGLISDNRLVSRDGSCGNWREGVQVRLESQSSGWLLRVDGGLARACGVRVYALAAPDVLRFAASLWRAAWEELGGRWQGRVRDGTAPVRSAALAEWQSPPLSDIVRDINKWSNNVMARQLLLTLGAEAASRPSRTPAVSLLQEGDEVGAQTEGARVLGVGVAQSEQVVLSWLAAEGMPVNGVVLANGSGLSRQGRLPAQVLGQLLLRQWQSPRMPEFLASLPILALDGTLRTRLRGTEAAGRGWLKTGTLDGVKSVAGYVQDRHGGRHAVVMLVNHPRAGQATPALDALLQWVVEGGASLP